MEDLVVPFIVIGISAIVTAGLVTVIRRFLARRETIGHGRASQDRGGRGHAAA